MQIGIRSIARRLRKIDLTWRFGYNFVPTMNYELRGSKRPRGVENSVLDALNSDGIAFTSVEELLGDRSGYDSLESMIHSILGQRENEIADLKAQANDSARIGEKTFNLELLGSEIDFDARSIFASFALDTTLLSVANAYLRMQAKLRYYNVWYTFASKGAPRESQLWHFDREDNYILKVFLYLDDVDDGSGPLTYAPGTHKKGKHHSIKPNHFMEGGVRRTTDAQMKEVFPEEKWVRATGKKGTIVFADTRGYHKGGEARTKDRLMFTCMYTSPASESRNLIRFPKDINLDPLRDEQIAALYIS